MTSPPWDAIVIGGGHNGLVTAAYLARAGRRVVLLERRPNLGGAASIEHSPSGVELPVGAQDLSLFRPQIIRELGLQLPLIRPEHSLTSLLPDGRALQLWRDPLRAAQSVADFSTADASEYPRFAAQIGRQAAILERMMDRVAPNLPLAGGWGGFRAAAPWLAVALAMRRLGGRPMLELVRDLPMDAARLLEERFESPELQGALASAGVIGLMQGPRAPGTALMLILQSIGGFPRGSTFMPGGVQQLTATLEQAATRLGVEIRTGAAIERILTDDYRTVGVRLASGEELRAEVVASSADPRHTLLDLVGAPELELRVVRQLQNIRFRGSTSRVNLVLDWPVPEFTGVADPRQLSGPLVIAPSIDYLERAYDDAKYGRVSSAPHLSMTMPTMSESPGSEPHKMHLLSIDVRYTPFDLKDELWSEQREQLGDRVVEVLSEYAPDLPRHVVHRQILTPIDLQLEYGLPEGSIHHGQMALDQMLFMRPIGGYAAYRSPVDGLYFCGAGAHPGGGLTGAPGRNAARVILKDLRKR